MHNVCLPSSLHHFLPRCPSSLLDICRHSMVQILTLITILASAFNLTSHTRYPKHRARPEVVCMFGETIRMYVCYVRQALLNQYLSCTMTRRSTSLDFSVGESYIRTRLSHTYDVSSHCFPTSNIWRTFFFVFPHVLASVDRFFSIFLQSSCRTVPFRRFVK